MSHGRGINCELRLLLLLQRGCRLHIKSSGRLNSSGGCEAAAPSSIGLSREPLPPLFFFNNARRPVQSCAPQHCLTSPAAHGRRQTLACPTDCARRRHIASFSMSMCICIRLCICASAANLNTTPPRRSYILRRPCSAVDVGVVHVCARAGRTSRPVNALSRCTTSRESRYIKKNPQNRTMHHVFLILILYYTQA